MKRIEDCNIGIMGLGLMGGAISRALRKCGAASPGRLLACDLDPSVLSSARGEGIIDRGFSEPEGMLEQCDLVFLCLNPSRIIKLWPLLKPCFKSGALVTDIAGAKGEIEKMLDQDYREDIDYIPGHPMAGSEKWGYDYSDHVDFRGKNYILTPRPRNKGEHIDFLKGLIRRMGFESITETTAEDHDSKIAFTSQLCHVIAAALIDCEGDTEITRFGGGSFEDLTRIAMLNAPMWTELFIENRGELLHRIDQFAGSLDTLRNLIQQSDAPALEALLGRVRDRRMMMTR